MLFKKSFLLLAFLALSFFIFAQDMYPEIAPSGSATRPGRFVWYELTTTDVSKAKTFYGTLLGWTFQDIISRDGGVFYTRVQNNGTDIGGIFPALNKAGSTGEWLGSVSVPDVAKAVAAVQKNGGKAIGKTMILNGRGKAALLSDNQGSFFAVLHSLNGDPIFAMPAKNAFLGMELWSNDQEASAKFYNALTGFTVQDVPKMGATAKAFMLDGKPVAGCIKNPFPNVRSHWMPYILVDNVQDMANKVEKAGGRLLFAPNKNIRNGTTALVLDPSGAPFVLQQL